MDEEESGEATGGGAKSVANDVGCGGHGGPSGVAMRGLTRRFPSGSKLAGMSEVSSDASTIVSRISALKASVDRNCSNVTQVLSASKETKDKKCQIEAAMRMCREAFMEVSSILFYTIEERFKQDAVIADIKKTIAEGFENVRDVLRLHQIKLKGKKIELMRLLSARLLRELG